MINDREERGFYDHGHEGAHRYDGSACDDAAPDDLKRAGLPGEVEGVVVTIAELWSPPQSATFKPALTATTEPAPAPVEAARDLAMAAGRRLQTIFPSWDERAESPVGSPASALLSVYRPPVWENWAGVMFTVGIFFALAGGIYSGQWLQGALFSTGSLSAEAYQPAPKSTCSTRSDWTGEVTVR